MRPAGYAILFVPKLELEPRALAPHAGNISSSRANYALLLLLLLGSRRRSWQFVDVVDVDVVFIVVLAVIDLVPTLSSISDILTGLSKAYKRLRLNTHTRTPQARTYVSDVSGPC